MLQKELAEILGISKQSLSGHTYPKGDRFHPKEKFVKIKAFDYHDKEEIIKFCEWRIKKGNATPQMKKFIKNNK